MEHSFTEAPKVHGQSTSKKDRLITFLREDWQERRMTKKKWEWHEQEQLQKSKSGSGSCKFNVCRNSCWAVLKFRENSLSIRLICAWDPVTKNVCASSRIWCSRFATRCSRGTSMARYVLFGTIRWVRERLDFRDLGMILCLFVSQEIESEEIESATIWSVIKAPVQALSCRRIHTCSSFNRKEEALCSGRKNASFWFLYRRLLEIHLNNN